MKIFNRSIIVIALTLTAGSVSAQGSLTLERYLGLVLDYNKDLKLAAGDRELASLQKRLATASALPSVGLESSYSRNITDYYMYFDMSVLNPLASGYARTPIKRDNEFTLTVGLEQTLFSSRVGSAIKAAGQYAALTDHVVNATRQAVIAGAKKLYHQCLLLERVTAVSREAEENARDNYRHMQLKFDSGQVSQFELLQAEIRWRAAIPETRKAERNEQLALATLRQMAGISPDSSLVLAGDLTHIPPLPQLLSLDTVLRFRPDFKAMEWEKRLRETSVAAAEGSYLPTLKGTVAWAYSAQSDEFRLGQENKLLFAGVSLSLPLFTGGYRPAMVQQARVELEKTTLTIAKAREQIAHDLTHIHLRLTEAFQRIASAEAVLAAAKKGFSIAETTARNGLATQLQLKDARIALDQATVNYYAAVYEYLDAYIDREQAAGTILTE